MTNETTAPERLEDAATRLATLKDEVRLKIHLAGMDARTMWEEELHPALETLERSLQDLLKKGLRSAGGARVQAHLGLMEAHELWEAIEPRVSETVDAIRASADDGRSDAKKGEVGLALRKLFKSTKAAVREATRDAVDKADATRGDGAA